jgi:hypothetical protein
MSRFVIETGHLFVIDLFLYANRGYCSLFDVWKMCVWWETRQLWGVGRFPNLFLRIFKGENVGHQYGEHIRHPSCGDWGCSGP